MNTKHARAFPHQVVDENGVHRGTTQGLTKRELFAAMAMQGNMASWTGLISSRDVESAAMLWVSAADALLAEIERVKS